VDAAAVTVLIANSKQLQAPSRFTDSNGWQRLMPWSRTAGISGTELGCYSQFTNRSG